MALTAEILTHLRADARQFNTEMASAQKSTATTASGFDKMANVGKVAFLGIAGAAAAVAVVGVQAAVEQEEATARLTQAIKNAGGTYKQYADEIGNAEKHSINLGFADDELDAGLTKLVNSTKDVHKSIHLMNLAEDIARGRHIDLSAATDILVKIEAGRVGALGRIGIATKDATGQTISQEEALRKLSDLYGGQAAKYAETYAGRLEILEAQLGEVAETIGFALLPVINTLVTAFVDVLNFFRDNEAAAIALAVVIGGPLVAAMLTWIATSIAAFATTGALGKSLNVLLTAVDAVVESLAAAGAATGAVEGSWAAVAAGAGVLAVALALPIAAAVGFGYVMHRIFGQDLQSDFIEPITNAQAAGKKWADGLIEQADKLAFMAPPLKTLHHDLDDLRLKQQSVLESEREGILSKDEAIKAYAKLDGSIKAIKGRIHELTSEQKTNVETTTQIATYYGITLPAGMNTADKATQDLIKTFGELEHKFGEGGTAAVQFLINLDSTGGALQTASKAFDTLMNSVSSFTNVATADLGDIANFLHTDMVGAVEFFVNSTNEKAQTWLTDMTALVATGVDSGIVAQFAAAGPKSDEALKGVLGAIDKNGVEWINSATEASRKMALAVALNMASMQLVTDGIMQTIETGSTAKLVTLANSADEQTRRAAVAALEHFGEITTGVGTIPTHVEININTIVNRGAMDELVETIRVLTGTVWSVPVRVDALSPLQAAQAAGVL